MNRFIYELLTEKLNSEPIAQTLLTLGLARALSDNAEKPGTLKLTLASQQGHTRKTAEVSTATE